MKKNGRKHLKFKGKLAILSFLTLALAACGGGGGGGGTAVRVDSTTDNTKTITFSNSFGKVSSGTANGGEVWNGVVLNADASGVDGVLVGVIDRGFSNEHNGRVIINKESSEYPIDGTYSQSHGDLVTNVITHESENARIYAVNGAKEGQISVTSTMYEALHNAGVTIYNHSFGSGQTTPIETLSGMEKVYQQLINNGDLIVWAAGNDAGENPHSDAQSPILQPALSKGWLVVTAVDANGKLMKYAKKDDGTESGASKAGNMKNYTISSLDQYSWNENAVGTSFAAPTVTAAAVEIKKIFPWMNGDLLRQTILSTANEPGTGCTLSTGTLTTGPKNDTGWGVLNLTRAKDGPAQFLKVLVYNDDGTQGDSVVVDTLGQSSEFKHGITGDAGLIKNGKGTLTLSGANSFTGDIIVNNGNLEITKSVASPITTTSTAATSKTSAYYGTLILTGNTNSKKITNNGLVYIRSGKANVDEFSGTGVLLIEADTGSLETSGASNKIDLTGIKLYIDISDGKLTSLTGKEKKEIITAVSSATLTGSSSTLEYYRSGYKATLTTNSNKIEVEYEKMSASRSLYVAMAAVPANVTAVAENLDAAFDAMAAGREVSAEFRAAAAGVMRTELDALPAVAASMTGEIYATSQNLTFEQQKDISRNLSNRMYGIVVENSDMGATWFDMIGAKGKIEKSGYASADTEMYGAQAGLHVPLTSSFTAGVALAATKSQLDFNGNAGKSDATALTASLYGVYAPSSVGPFAMAKFGIGTVDTDVNRQVYNGSDYVDEKTSRDDMVYSLYAEVGYRFGLTDKAGVAPFVGFAYDSVSRGAISESSAFGIVADKHTYDQTAGVVGVRGDLSLTDKFALKADVTYYSGSNQDLTIKGRWAGDAASTINAKGIGLSKDTTWAGIGAEYKASETLSFDLTYNYKMSHTDSHVGTLGFKYKF